MTHIFNILVAGVGGQGNLACSRIIAKASMLDGWIPVVGQTFGASRRGGTVFTHIRMARERIVGPLIPEGHLDLVLGLEPLEALRGATLFGHDSTECIVCARVIQTLDTLAGVTEYPQIDEVRRGLETVCSKVYWVTPRTCTGVGLRQLNALMTGVMVGLENTPLSRQAVEKAMHEMPGNRDLNRAAFEQGLAVAESLTD